MLPQRHACGGAGLDWLADLPVDTAHPAQVAQQRVLLRDPRRLRVVVDALAAVGRLAGSRTC